MPNSSSNGNVMVERSRSVAKASFTFCRATLGRRLIDTVRCGGSSSGHHKRSSPMTTAQEVPKQPQKSGFDGENLHVGHKEIGSHGGIQIDVRDEDQSLKSVERTGKQLKNMSALDPKEGSSRKTTEDLEWRQLVESLRNDSKILECRSARSIVTQEEATIGRDEEEIEHVERKIRAFNELQTVVQSLQFGNEIAQKKAAIDIRKLAKDDAHARVTLAMLGAIPPLVGMLDSSEANVQTSALFALLNLAIGNDLNKAAIVKAGAVQKMVTLLQGSNESVREAVVTDFLSLSALDVNKPIIGSSGAIPFLVNIMQHGSTQGRRDALRALYNLSICPANAALIVDTNVVEFLLNIIDDMDVSEKILGILSNLAATEEGRKAIGQTNDAFPILIDVLNWVDAPKCQEKAAFILMIIAHNSWSHRRTMVESGVVSSLLELTLLGTTLAQKRASRILECLRDDKIRKNSTMSAPISGQHTDLEPINKDEYGDHMSEERKVVNRLVQQSLQHNMQRIIKRANLPQDFAPSDRFKSLTATSSSKSLPF
ncbi:hypothetical protein SUGI_0574990 [Cryptomeria japonica]|uniref:U-box domain-containing protein 4 n=1 Tax=Cryptomeria japonica TaxID=3369 RepID=UPI002408A29B|nr:U-box domain-containing protein 4 [Cryptomeria japonica]GLJ29162.1 hypothetical protein SUGI_0574990 [Cryptomeria japonica]